MKRFFINSDGCPIEDINGMCVLYNDAITAIEEARRDEREKSAARLRRVSNADPNIPNIILSIADDILQDRDLR